MRYSSAIVALAAPLLASAAPAYRRAAAASDILVFQFADVLEQLESKFYEQALSKFQDNDFRAAGYTSSQVPIEQFTTIQKDEATHSSVLQDALKSFGAQPITSCKFNFDAALKDVTTMAATARVVENVGVAAYLGGSVLIKDPVLLTAAASILTVEARHQTMLNLFSNGGTGIPNAFDFAFTPSEVLALASPFISGCDVGIPSNVPLSVTNTGTVAPGTLLSFQASSINGTIPQEKLNCQMLVGGATESISLPLSQCVVPQGINGPVALFITNDPQPLNNNVVDRATVNVVAGPALAFVDTVPQSINRLIVSGQGVTGGSGSSNEPLTATATLTISPSQASQVAAEASSTGTAAEASSTGAAAEASSTGAAAPAATPSAEAGTPGPSGSTTAPVVSASDSAIMTTGPSPDGKIVVNGWSGM